MNNKNTNLKIVSHDSTNANSLDSDQKIIRHLKDETREYKRQIKILKRTIESLTSNIKQNQK
tara:strand:+ start:271 stop:456 length:186 start_codon:yes stop_codon:yes gene_type:complete